MLTAMDTHRHASRPFFALVIAVLCFPIGVSANANQPMAFRHITVSDGLSQNTVMDVLQDRHGFIWLATENGLDRYDGYAMRRYQRGPRDKGELVNDYIWEIAEDPQSNLDAGDRRWRCRDVGSSHGSLPPLPT